MKTSDTPATKDLEQRISALEEEISRLENQKSLDSIAFHSLTNPIQIVDLNGVYLWVNTAFADNYELKPEDFIGKSLEVCISLIGGLSVERIRRITSLEFTEESEDEVELPGGKKWFASEHQPLKNDRGELFAVQVISHDVTEVKQTEQALLESEMKYRLLIDNYAHPILLFNTDGTIRVVNKAAAHDLNVAPGELVGKPLDSYMPSFAGRVEERHRRVVETGEGSDHLDVIQLPSSAKWFASKLLPMKDAGGEVLGVQVIAYDVTEKKESEERLLLLKAAMEQSTDGIALLRLDGHIEFVNSSWAKMHGYEAAELVGVHFNKFHTKEQLEQEIIPFQDRIVATGRSEGEVGHVTRNGKTFPTWMSTNVLQNEDGDLVGAVSIARDISQQKAAEKALVESERKFRRLFESYSDPILILDNRGIIDSNAATLRVFGFSHSGEVYRKQLWDMSPRTQPGGRRSKELLSEYISDAVTQGMSRFEWVCRRQSGTDFPAEIAINTLEIVGQSVLQMVIRDITVQKRVEREIRLARARAEQASTVKSQFLANISHEIRTPMNGVIGMTNLLLDTELTQAQQNYAQIAKTSADSLMTIVNDILDFSNMETNKVALKFEDFDFGLFIDQVTKTLEESVRPKGLACSSRIEPNIPSFLVGDAELLRRVVLDLIGNAVKFTSSGEVSLQVGIEEEGEEWVSIRFSIRDTGIGIPEDQLDSVFEPFTQVDASITRQHGGCGLGLSIAKELVELMAGEIDVESTQGKGSKFWFTVTLLKKVEFGDSTAQDSAPLEGKKILVVDSDRTSRRWLSVLLRSWGSDLNEAADGINALTLLKTAAAAGKPFDVAIVDEQVPVMKAEVVAAKIREDLVLQDALLVLASSDSGQGASTPGEERYTALLPKPIRQSNLLDCLAGVLDL